jgi:hypothetical protein
MGAPVRLPSAPRRPLETRPHFGMPAGARPGPPQGISRHSCKRWRSRPPTPEASNDSRRALRRLKGRDAQSSPLSRASDLAHLLCCRFVPPKSAPSLSQGGTTELDCTARRSAAAAAHNNANLVSVSGALARSPAERCRCFLAHTTRTHSRCPSDPHTSVSYRW